ncbi:MAG: type II toxin-antitoxin system RelE/ParE family toxin [Planctomycetota bacterium]
MALEPRFANEAETEFDDAAAWIEERNPAVAARFVEHVHEVVGRICRRPTQFPKVDEEHRSALVPKSKYVVIFRVEGDVAVIVAVMHASRQPEYWRGREE